MKKYLFTMYLPGNSSLMVILQDYDTTKGRVVGTKVGQLSGWNDQHEKVFESCDPTVFIAGGGPWTIEVFSGELV